MKVRVLLRARAIRSCITPISNQEYASWLAQPPFLGKCQHRNASWPVRLWLTLVKLRECVLLALRGVELAMLWVATLVFRTIPGSCQPWPVTSTATLRLSTTTTLSVMLHALTAAISPTIWSTAYPVHRHALHASAHQGTAHHVSNLTTIWANA